MPSIEKLYQKVEVLGLRIEGTAKQLIRPDENGADRSIDRIDFGSLPASQRRVLYGSHGKNAYQGVAQRVSSTAEWWNSPHPGRTATARLMAGVTGTETYFCTCSPVGPPCEF